MLLHNHKIDTHCYLLPQLFEVHIFGYSDTTHAYTLPSVLSGG